MRVPSLRLRAARWLTDIVLFRAAHRVLLARSIRMTDGSELRWLGPEFRAFRVRMKARRACLPPMRNPPRHFGNLLLVDLVETTLAANIALRDMGVAGPVAQEVVADIGWVVYAKMLKACSLPFRLTSRDPARRLERTVRMLLRFPFAAPGAPGYAVSTRMRDGAILTHFTHCPPHTRVRQLAGHTGDRALLDVFRVSWCRYDWPGADLIASDGARGHYRRNGTLSHGDKVCDMCWSAAPLPASPGAQKSLAAAGENANSDDHAPRRGRPRTCL